MQSGGGGNRSGGGRNRGGRGRQSQLVYRPVDRSFPVVANGDYDASPGSGSSGTGACGTRGGGGRHNTSRGRSQRSQGVAISDDASQGTGFSRTGNRYSDIPEVNGLTKKFNAVMKTDHSHVPNSEAEINTPEPLFASRYGNDEENQTLSCLNSVPLDNVKSDKKEPYRSVRSGFPDCQTPQESQTGGSTSERTSGKVDTEKSDSHENGQNFDICRERDTKIPKLKPSMLQMNREIKREMKGRSQGGIEILKTGMILLKGFISLNDQVKLIKMCRDLGRGDGGFYQPGYRDGAKLNLKMMCLGKNWDPETSTYGDKRPIDNTRPPPIPDEFKELVEGVLQKCHHHLELESKKKNVRDIIPSMSPTICIVNFLQCLRLSALSTSTRVLEILVFIRIKMKVKKVYAKDSLLSRSLSVTLLNSYMETRGTLTRQIKFYWNRGMCWFLVASPGLYFMELRQSNLKQPSSLFCRKRILNLAVSILLSDSTDV